MTINAVLALILLFQIRHFICDGPLQTKAMVHGFGSLVALAWFGLGWKMVLGTVNRIPLNLITR